MIGRLKDMAFDRSGKCILSLTLEDDFRDGYDELNDKDLVIDIKPYRKKRSGEANRYMWVLCGEIASVAHITKDEVYRRNVREVGVFTALSVSKDAYERFSAVWREKGVGWFCEVVDERDDGYLEIFAYSGSSTYDTAQMTRLIDAVIADAKALGIETATLSELELLRNN